MTEVLDQPVIDLPPIDAALIDAPRTDVAVAAEPKQATLKETALASFSPIVAHMTTLAQRYRNVAFDLLTPKGLAAAKAARLELREDGRYAVQRLQKRLKEEANDLKRTIDAKAEEAIGIVKPVEDAIHAQIEAHEAKVAADKAKREQAEAERKAKHEAGIAKIRAYLPHCQQPGMTSARIQAGMDMLRAATFGPEWEEYAVPAANAQCETLEAMQRLHAAALDREEAATRAAEEAARLEAQRIENERIAAELAAQQRALAEQAAELARQQQEIEAARARRDAEFADMERVTGGYGHDPKAATAGAHCASEAPRHEGIAQNATGEPVADPCVGSRDSERGAGVGDPQCGSGVDSADEAGCAGLGDETGRSDAAAAEPAPVATHPDADDHGADLLLDPGTAAAEAAEFASWTAGPVQMVGFEGQLYDPELIDIIRWAYSKLHASEFADIEDALMLDRMKLLLAGESL